MSRRVILHVGTPKTGTSHLQDVLFRNRAVLEEHGILYPAERFDGHFLAALDLMNLTWGGLEAEAVGAWDSLAEQVREWEGTSIVSHEILATASPSQVTRAITSFGPDVEVHLVLSVRDLVRQVPAEWQENVKHRSRVGYRTFLDQITDPARDSRIGTWFWGAQEIPDILERWGAGLPPEHVRLVTVPPAGAPRDELWQRFSRTFGLAGLPLDVEGERANPSMGVPETALMREINVRVTPVVDPPDYRPLVRELLAHQTLSARTDSSRLALPPDAHAWARDLADAWIAELRERGYTVEGDLDDLRGPEPRPFVDPDAVAAEDMLDPAYDVITALVLEGARLRGREAALDAEAHRLREELVEARRSWAHRQRRRAFLALSESPVGRTALGLYRRLRGRAA